MPVLTSLDLSNFNTCNVISMDYMFGGRRALVNLNLSGFDTHKVTNMNNMLYDCMELEQVNYGTKFVNDSLVYAAYMYKGAKNCNKPNWTNGTFDDKGHWCPVTS